VLDMIVGTDEIREHAFGYLDDDIELRPQELHMAQSLIDTMAGDFHPEQYSDNYREALQALIDAKIAGREVVAPAEPAAETGTVVDLMAALRASVEAARQGRNGDAPAASAAPSDAPSSASAKKAAKPTKKPGPAAKKAPAKKTAAAGGGKRANGSAAKKTTAKRTNARKSA